jgi:hypothetical protein
VLWNQSAPTPAAGIDLPLGSTARLLDLFGNSRQPAFNPSTGLTHLDVGATPLILDSVDPRVITLRASFALASSTLPAGAGSFHTQVQLTNPGPDPYRGTLRFLPPKGWTVEPSTLRISLAPGESLHENITLHYPFTESAGPKTFAARLVGEPDTTPATLDLSFPLTVASSLVTIDGFTQLLANGDLVVQQMITNTASTPLNAQAYALVPGYPRQQRFITDLRPGQTAIKRYIFPAGTFTPTDDPPAETPHTNTPESAGGAPKTAAADSSKSPAPDAAAIARALAGKSAALGVRQPDGRTLLTKSLPLD